MKKTGIINRVHKGFRVWLFETGTLVQQTDFTHVMQGRKTVSALFHLLKSLDRKSFLEEHYFLPALAIQAPFALSLVEDDHKKLKELSFRLTRTLESYLLPGTEGHYRAKGLCIQESYMDFLSQVLIYMNRQESLFQGLTSQDEAIESANLVSLTEDHRMEFAVWILKGMNNREFSDWLESETEGSLVWKRKVLGTLSPERLQALGLDFELRVRTSMAAA
jgi:hypothetical protein